MSQNVLSPQPPGSMMQLACEASQPAPVASCKPSRELVTAWILLLLDRRATYGYELHRQLQAHAVTTELGAMYRVLRRLEDEGCAASTWARSISGPRRRLYELTAQGRCELGALVAAITATRDVHAAFLHAHDAFASGG